MLGGGVNQRYISIPSGGGRGNTASHSCYRNLNKPQKYGLDYEFSFGNENQVPNTSRKKSWWKPKFSQRKKPNSEPRRILMLIKCYLFTVAMYINLVDHGTLCINCLNLLGCNVLTLPKQNRNKHKISEPSSAAKIVTLALTSSVHVMSITAKTAVQLLLANVPECSCAYSN